MNYINRVAQLLNECADRGLTQQEIAQKLGVKSKNYISMISGKDKDSNSPLSLNRIPALVSLCGLSAKQGLELVLLRAKCHPDNPTHFDQDSLASVMRWTRTVLQERGMLGGLSHGE